MNKKSSLNRFETKFTITRPHNHLPVGVYWEVWTQFSEYSILQTLDIHWKRPSHCTILYSFSFRYHQKKRRKISNYLLLTCVPTVAISTTTHERERVIKQSKKAATKLRQFQFFRFSFWVVYVIKVYFYNAMKFCESKVASEKKCVEMAKEFWRGVT